MSTRYLTEEPLRVVDGLRGQPLASPLRRALALAADWAVLVLPSVAVALGAALLSLRRSDPGGYRALLGFWQGGPAEPTARHALLREMAPMLVRAEAPGLPAAVAAAVEAGDLDGAAALLEEVDFTFALSLGPHNETPLPPHHVRVEIERLIPKALRAAAVFGVGALYFTLLTRGRRGATLGKRLLGIRVVRLDGGRLSLRESFERFSGYFHIPSSLGLALLDLWHDPNRRLPHDRVVHTAVVRVSRRGKR
jgi:uncharacterized RDD family membrane protein YckC